MKRALIVYSTKTGNTRGIAEYIGEGVRFSGFQEQVKNIEEISDPQEISEYDGIVIGSATYGGQMMEEMKQFLGVAASLNLEEKKGGAFGAYGWSGEAPDEIFKIMKEHFKMDMVNDSLRLKAAEIQGGMKMAQDYGRGLAALMEYE